MPKITSLSNIEYLAKIALFKSWAPDPLKAFHQLAHTTFRDGALSNKEKELIAIGCAHVLRCSYCISYHVELARTAGASAEEMSEAIWVGVAMGASACFNHASIAFKTIAGEKGDTYSKGNLDYLKDFAALVPASHEAYTEFCHQVFKAGALATDAKLLIAIGCAHNTRCPFCIDHYVNEALATGHSREAVAEAIWVAVEMGAGAGAGHAGLAAAIME